MFSVLLPYKSILPCDCQGIYCLMYCTFQLYDFHILVLSTLRLLNLVGQGSFGTVHKAIWRGVIVAAKVIQVGQEKSKIMAEVEKCQ